MGLTDMTRSGGPIRHENARRQIIDTCAAGWMDDGRSSVVARNNGEDDEEDQEEREREKS